MLFENLQNLSQCLLWEVKPDLIVYVDTLEFHAIVLLIIATYFSLPPSRCLFIFLVLLV